MFEEILFYHTFYDQNKKLDKMAIKIPPILMPHFLVTIDLIDIKYTIYVNHWEKTIKSQRYL